MIYPQMVPVAVATTDGGPVVISVDTSLGFGAGGAARVVTSVPITMVGGTGLPTNPGMTGVAAQDLEYPGRVIPANTIIELFVPFANSLVEAGVAVFIDNV